MMKKRTQFLNFCKFLLNIHKIKYFFFPGLNIHKIKYFFFPGWNFPPHL